MSVSVRHDLSDAFFRHRYRVASAVPVIRRVPVSAPVCPYPAYDELVSGAASLPKGFRDLTIVAAAEDCRSHQE
ncbi:hypothetical protein [Rathayibacter toxicus]|uniref:hypothetical protein n=1 Tax=Rathayibacter toxicus TaxID=145458 RepID=UPI000D40BF47|nr:hypothetical protein [Rathayibacter toxicus]PPI55523.1 hypothetical protein C5D35_04110 [Rathayibacter toxicus]QOD09804.1 hypothetical protein BSG36_07570 [Rathayibacter toxicus]QWL28468.1 hypothetical protein E2R33_07565 [Rathayibacter toxicus]